MLKTSLYKHQQIAFNKLKKYTVGALFMDMGTGKTRVTLELIKSRKNKCSNIIWFCPVSTKPALKKEIKKHSHYSFCDLSDGYEKSDIYVCGWESIASSDRVYLIVENIVDVNTFLVADESIFIKNYKSKRTERSTKLSDRVKYKLILNGTPFSVDQSDLFCQFRFLSPKILGFNSWHSFAANHIVYSDKYPGKIDYILNSDMISEKIAPFTYQIKKEDYYTMPKKSYQSIYYDLSDDAIRFYDFVKVDILNTYNQSDRMTILRLFSHLQSVTSGFTNYDIYQDTFDITNKLKTLKDYILFSGHKVIVACKYKFEISQINSYLKNEFDIFNYHGSQKDDLDDWLNTEKGVLIANESCAGYGHNLQECNHIIFFSSSFDYAKRKQMEDRVYRPEQKNKVLIQSFVALNTIDEFIQDNLHEKEMKLADFEKEVDKIKNDLEFINKICGGFKDAKEILNKQ